MVLLRADVATGNPASPQASSLSNTDAVKRLLRKAYTWISQSTNPNYDDLRIPAAECPYPILGILVGRV